MVPPAFSRSSGLGARASDHLCPSDQQGATSTELQRTVIPSRCSAAELRELARGHARDVLALMQEAHDRDATAALYVEGDMRRYRERAYARRNFGP